ncbi:hypothetical protein AVEN_35579-1 [Araneus ventricosus]|uniref:Uncharacterized protein n=1 Tax=Araneus ventricosus TaxID=182803 RepID=A0A4Y2CKZ3_ARAVE|nr:hypothetical protein AVEN_35579-1 [Araneus ventricosus]
MADYACFQFKKIQKIHGESMCFLHRRNLSEIPTIRSRRDSSPDNDEVRYSENFSKLPERLQSVGETFSSQDQYVAFHNLARRQYSLHILVRQERLSTEEVGSNRHF